MTDFSFHLSPEALQAVRGGQSLFVSMSPDVGIETLANPTEPYDETLELRFVVLKGTSLWGYVSTFGFNLIQGQMQQQELSFGYTNTAPIYATIYELSPTHSLSQGQIATKIMPLGMYERFAFRVRADATVLWDSARHAPDETTAIKAAVDQGARFTLAAELADGTVLKAPVGLLSFRTKTQRFDLTTTRAVLPSFFFEPDDLLQVLEQHHPALLQEDGPITEQSLRIGAGVEPIAYAFYSDGGYQPQLSATAGLQHYKRLRVLSGG